MAHLVEHSYYTHFICTECEERFDPMFLSAAYYVGTAPLSDTVAATDLLPIPVEPVWCLDCQKVAIAEIIEPLRVFEDAVALFRLGHVTGYPMYTWDGDADYWLGEKALLMFAQWRLARRSRARALCCGSYEFQPLQTEGVRIKHQGCPEGQIRGRWGGWGDYYTRLNHTDKRIYDPEGELIGVLGESDSDLSIWATLPAKYVPVEDSGGQAGIPSRWIWLERQ